jgi:hypothetical protein
LESGYEVSWAGDSSRAALDGKALECGLSHLGDVAIVGRSCSAVSDEYRVEVGRHDPLSLPARDMGPVGAQVISRGHTVGGSHLFPHTSLTLA